MSSCRGGYNLVTFICEPIKLLPYLQKKIEANGGQFIIKKITDFEELSGYDVVVNCSGLSSKILANDNKVDAIRGQVARVIEKILMMIVH